MSERDAVTTPGSLRVDPRTEHLKPPTRRFALPRELVPVIEVMWREGVLYHEIGTPPVRWTGVDWVDGIVLGSLL